MRKCQGYQDLSGENRRDDRAQKEAFCGLEMKSAIHR